MSEYTPLTRDEEYYLDDSPPSRNETSKMTNGSTRARVGNALATILLVANVVVWAFAFVRLAITSGSLQEDVDIVETRSLERPDVLDGLESLGVIGG